MYKKNKNRQISLADFNQPLGFKINQENRWVKKADVIPWEDIEEKYAKLFPSHTGMPAKPLRMALGALLIQKQYGYSDEELVQQLAENPYYQYFIGRPIYQNKIPFVPSLLVEFRKRLTEEKICEINELILQINETDKDDDNEPKSGLGKEQSQENEQKTSNRGILIIDATCAPSNSSCSTSEGISNT